MITIVVIKNLVMLSTSIIQLNKLYIILTGILNRINNQRTWWELLCYLNFSLFSFSFCNIPTNLEGSLSNNCNSFHIIDLEIEIERAINKTHLW